MQKGNIGVTTENIFPVIKKFLYSDHEIFLREIVSNAIDATQKLKTLYEKGEFKGEFSSPKVTVTLGTDTKTQPSSFRKAAAAFSACSGWGRCSSTSAKIIASKAIPANRSVQRKFIISSQTPSSAYCRACSNAP